MISVIVTCFNEGKLLYRAIESLKKQTYQNFEVIIVKDFSDHRETIEVCRDLEVQGYCVLWTEKNVGVSVTRNMGIEKAVGEIIYTLDADDELPNNALQIVSETFEKSKAEFVYGNYFLDENNGKKQTIVNCGRITTNGFLDNHKLFKGWNLLGMSPFKKSLWEKVGGYSEEFSYSCQDVDFQIKSLSLHAKAAYIDEVIYIWHKMNTGINSSLKNRQDLDKCYYNHIEFINKYISTRYTLAICETFKDVKKYRLYFRKHIHKEKKIFLSIIEPLCSYKILTALGRFMLNRR